VKVVAVVVRSCVMGPVHCVKVVTVVVRSCVMGPVHCVKVIYTCILMMGIIMPETC
jgi:hypothetical protein